MLNVCHHLVWRYFRVPSSHAPSCYKQYGYALGTWLTVTVTVLGRNQDSEDT